MVALEANTIGKGLVEHAAAAHPDPALHALPAIGDLHAARRDKRPVGFREERSIVRMHFGKPRLMALRGRHVVRELEKPLHRPVRHHERRLPEPFFHGVDPNVDAAHEVFQLVMHPRPRAAFEHGGRFIAPVDNEMIGSRAGLVRTGDHNVFNPALAPLHKNMRLKAVLPAAGGKLPADRLHVVAASGFRLAFRLHAVFEIRVKKITPLRVRRNDVRERRLCLEAVVAPRFQIDVELAEVRLRDGVVKRRV